MTFEYEDTCIWIFWLSTDVWLQSGADIIFGSKEEPGTSQMWQNGMVSQKLADCVMRFYGSYVRLDVTLRHKSERLIANTSDTQKPSEKWQV